MSSSDSDATVDPGSDAATEPDSDATVEPDTQDFDSSQDLFSDPSDDEKETSVKMSSRVVRQTTHAISDSGSDSETEIKSSSKHRHNSHKSSHSSSSAGKVDSKKVSSGHHRGSSSHSSTRDVDPSRSKSRSHRSSSSKSNLDMPQKSDKSSKTSVSSNGSGLFSDFLDLSSSETTSAVPVKLPSLTSTPEKAPTPKSATTKKNSKLHDIFGSDSEDSAEDGGVGVGSNDAKAKQDPNDLVPQPTSPSPPPLSSPSPPPSPSSVSSPDPTSAQVSSLSFDKAIDFDSTAVPKAAKSKPSSLSTSSSKQSLPKSSNSVSKSESRKPDHSLCHSSSSSSTTSSKKEPVKDVTNKSSSAVSESLLNKRKQAGSNKPMCKYGSDCTRKNPLHWAEYEHFDESLDQSPSSKKQKCGEQGSSVDEKVVRRKYKDAQPFSFFLTQVKGIDAKYNSSFALDISEILSPAFGNMQASCQFNYMIDIAWLVQQYSPEFRKKPLLVVHGFTGSEQKGLQQDASKFSHISLCQARLDIPYGTHHSKMMFLLYDNGMKVVIHTANLIPGDWHQKTQAIWMSPLFPKLKCGANKNEGHSPTSFKKDLLQYVAAYKNSSLTEWERHILEHDMSAARVHLIASVPGRHTMLQKNAWGHLKLRKVLIDNGPDKMEMEPWPLIGQFSSIGSLGPSPDKWLCGEFYQSLAACRTTSFSTPQAKNLKLIYPTVDNVRVSLEGYPAGTCLPYSTQTASKQSYLINFLHHWRSEGRGRTRACPHIKTYMRASPDFSMAAWFIVTSANLSKAAWGVLEKNGSQLMIRSYEIGVMFLPNLFDMRRLRLTSDVKEATNSEKSMFLLPYDVPLTRYDKDDAPWIYDQAYKELPDTNGMMWCPSLL